MLRKSGGKRVLRQFGDGAGKLHAGRSRADDDEGQQRRAPLRIAFALGVLEGDQDAAPQRGGVLQRLQPGRERLPFVMAEIGVAGAGGEHQRVVGQRVAAIQRHAARRGVHAGHRGEQGRDLRTAAQQIADRPGDLRGRQRRGGDLIEQRLEQMMVAPVDQRDRDRRAVKPVHRLQAAETGADDHDAVGCRRGRVLCRHGRRPLVSGFPNVQFKCSAVKVSVQ